LAKGETAVYYPRRGYDLWNTRYFVLPSRLSNDEYRGAYSLLPNSEKIYPPPDQFKGPEGAQLRAQWDYEEDWQIFRNLQAYPRAWVVHGVRVFRPIQGLNREDRAPLMEELIYAADALWNNPQRLLYDPRETVWIESDDFVALQEFHKGGPASPAEMPRITRYEPQHVEIEVTMERAGILVLADVDYPGWVLTVDGAPAPILRANRLMRGVALRAGPHHLVFRYQPASLQYGACLTLCGGFVLLGMVVWCTRQRAPAAFAAMVGPEKTS
jgi:hypothetical protein